MPQVKASVPHNNLFFTIQTALHASLASIHKSNKHTNKHRAINDSVSLSDLLLFFCWICRSPWDI